MAKKARDNVQVKTDAAGNQIASISNVKTYEIKQYVTQYTEGTLDDWPAQMQDAVYEALDRLAERVEHPVTVVASWMDIDYGDTGDDDRPFAVIVASEIVVADSRYMELNTEEKIRQAILELHNSGGSVQ